MQENAARKGEILRRSVLDTIQSPFPIAKNNTNNSPTFHHTPSIPKAVTWEDASPQDSPILDQDDSQSLPDHALDSQWAMMELNTTIDVGEASQMLLSPVSRGVFDTPATTKRQPISVVSSLPYNDNDETDFDNDDAEMLKTANPDCVFRRNSTDIALNESQGLVDTIHHLEHSTTEVLKRNETLVKEIRFSDTTCVELSLRQEQLSQQVERLTFEKEELRTEKHTLQETVQNLTALLQQSQQERTTLADQTSSLEGQLQASQQTVSSQTSSIQELQQQLEHSQLQLQQQRLSSQETIAQLRRQVEEQTAANTSLESRLESQVRTSKANMERIFDTATKQLDRLNESVESKQSALSSRLHESQANLAFLSTQLEFEDATATNHGQDARSSNQQQVARSGFTTPSHTLSSIPTEAVNFSDRSSMAGVLEDPANRKTSHHANESTSNSIPTQSLDMTTTTNNGMASPPSKQQHRSMDTLEGFEGYSLLSPSSESTQQTSDNYKQTSDFGQHIEWMASPTPFLQNTGGTAAYTSNESVGFASDLTGSEGGVSFLEHELDTVRTLLDETTRERDALALQVESMALSEIKSGSQKQSTDLHERLQTLHEDKQQLEHELADKSEALETALEKLAELKATVIAGEESQHLQEQLKESQSAQSTLQEKLTVVSQRLDDTEGLLEDAKVENKRLQATLSTKSNSLDDIRSNLNLLQAEKDALSLKVDVRTKDCRALQKGIAYYQAPATNCKSVKRKSRFKPWKRKESKIRIKTPRKVILSPDPKSPGSYESKALLDRIAGLENEIRNLTARQLTAKDIASDLCKAKSSLEVVLLERDDLRMQVDNIRKTFGDDLNKVQTAYEQLQESHKALEERLSAETAALLLVQKENDGLISDLESALATGTNNAEMTTMHEQELENFQTELKSCHEKIASLEEKLCIAHTVHETEKKQLLEPFQTELKSRHEKIASLEEKLCIAHTVHETEKKQLLERLEESKSGYDQLLQDYEKAREQVQRAKKENVFNAVVPSTEKSQSAPNRNQLTNYVGGDARRTEQRLREGQHTIEAIRSHMNGVLHDLQTLDGLADRCGRNASRRGSTESSHPRVDATVGAVCLEHMRLIETELSQLEDLLQLGTDEAIGQRERNEDLTLKCGRLKDYIRKLTKKCDEWEAFHQRQAEVLHQWKLANDRACQKAAELAQRCKQSDLLYTVEKRQVNNLQQERGQLQGELSNIARELSNIRSFAPSDSSNT